MSQKRDDTVRIPERRQSAFTIVELLVVMVILLVVFAVLFPVFAKGRGGSRHNGCASNQKQIGLALLGYIQDYDEKFPPAGGYWQAPDSHKVYLQDWVLDQYIKTSPRDTVIVYSILNPYIKNMDILKCPEAYKQNHGVRENYMYNDLAAEQSVENFTAASKTVLVCDGADQIPNAGHAWEPDSVPLPAVIGSNGLPQWDRGATINASTVRHSNGNNFLLSDGHVKWFVLLNDGHDPDKPEGTKSDTVYFPRRTSFSSVHNNSKGHAVGPDPAGDMTFEGHTYTITFQIK